MGSGLRAPVLGIIGPGEDASAEDIGHAESLGALAAAEHWTLVNGGIDSGVMAAATRGARRAGGLVVGVLPSPDAAEAAPGLTITLLTGMGQARNNIIVLSSDAVAVCGMSPGTAVEAALAVKARRPLVFVAATPATRAFFQALGPRPLVHFADSADGAMSALRTLLGGRR